MLTATQLQKRVVAIATALSLVCVGLLARHHEAQAAHARESSGRIVHAQELADHHVGGVNAHLHESAGHGHDGDCGLLALAHAPILDAAPVVFSTPVAARTHAAPPLVVVTGASIAGYRLAPKTSPPSA